MNNLEWQNNIGMIAENAVVKNGVEVGVNLVIALRDSDYDNYKKLGFDWLLEEHKEPIKLKQWEYDLIRNCEEVHDYDELDELCEYWAIEAMMEKGYFKGIKNLGATFKDILDNYIIVSDDYEGFEDCK